MIILFWHLEKLYNTVTMAKRIFNTKGDFLMTDYMTPMQLRSKYYCNLGVIIYDIVSLMGNENIMFVKAFYNKSSILHKDEFYYIPRQYISTGIIDYASLPVRKNCTPYFFNTYKLDDRCIALSGDMNSFNAMLIQEKPNRMPIVLGRESFAIRFRSKEDAISAHAWFTSEEVSSTVKSMLREEALRSNKGRIRLSLEIVKQLPIPSMEWLKKNHTNSMLKAKCIGLGSHIMLSLHNADAEDPMYKDVLNMLETTMDQIKNLGSKEALCRHN